MDRRTMKDLEPLRSQNPSIVYCTQWHHISEDGKVGNILLFPWFPHVLQYGFYTLLCSHQNYQYSRFRSL